MPKKPRTLNHSTPASMTTTGNVPVVLGRGPAEGTEHLTSDDVDMPRLVLAQAMSPQVNKSHPDYVKGLGVGDLFNSVSGHVYGPGPLTFSVLVARPPRAVEFVPLSEGGGVLDPHVALDDVRLTFGPNGEHPKATKFYDYVLYLRETQELISLSLARSGLKAAKSLNGLILMRRSAVYTGLYSVTTVSATSKEGTYMTWRFRNEGDATATEIAQYADRHRSLKGAVIAPDHE